MYSRTPYVMRDQVHGLVGDLMHFDPRGDRRRPTRFLELCLFAGALCAYLMALGLSA